MKKFIRNRPTYSEAMTPLEADVKPALQPPLPSYPPPPDAALVIKQERPDEDDEPVSPPPEYAERLDAPAPAPAPTAAAPAPAADSPAAAAAAATTAAAAASPAGPPAVVVGANVNPKDKYKNIMCKKFARGECDYAYCRYAHRIIIGQLDGVFTFCKNYQNSVGCSGVNCKYVHADVFEKARYLRTGILPPHARAHIPPPPQTNTTPNPCAKDTFQRPVANPGYLAPQTPMQPVPNGEAALGAASGVAAAPAREPAALWPAAAKREWTDGVTSPPSDHSDHIVKKCKNCEISEFRLQFNADRVKTTLQTQEELRKKVTTVEKKNKTLTMVLTSLLKPSILETLNSMKANDSRITSHPVVTTNDSIKNMFSGSQNLMSLVTQILRGIGDAQHPDSREP